MANLQILNSKQIKQIEKLLNNQFDCNYSFDYIVMQNKDKKIYLMNKDYSKIADKEIRINSLGMYFGQVKENELRLTIEGSQVIGPLAKKRVLEIDDSQVQKWMRGYDIEVLSPEAGFFIVKHKKDYLGSGKLKNGNLLNHIPKIRRIQSTMPL